MNSEHDRGTCKIQMSMGRRFSSDEVELRVRQWLLEGMRIGDVPQARRKHVMDIKPRALDALSRAEQDALLPV